MIAFVLHKRKTYYLTHPHTILIELLDWIVAFLQRGSRGYADRDVWDLSNYLSEWMPKAIRLLKADSGGFPPCLVADTSDYNFSEAQTEAAFQQWQQILEDIAAGFEAVKQLEDQSLMPDAPEYVRLKAAQKKGLQLFVEHYDSLWS